MALESLRVLTSSLNVHFGLLFGLLGPEQGDRAADLHVREHAGIVVVEHDHFSLHEIAHVALFVDTP